MSRWRSSLLQVWGRLRLPRFSIGKCFSHRTPWRNDDRGWNWASGPGSALGETKWAHNASSIPGLGDPTSKLTYKDVGTNVVDLTGKFWVTPRVFGRLNFGYAAIGGGRLTDDDYGSNGGQRLFSETNSDINGNSMWYINADFGGKVKEFANHRGYLEVFGGYQYWYTRYQAAGIARGGVRSHSDSRTHL